MKRIITLAVVFLLGVSVGAGTLALAQAEHASAIARPQERVTVVMKNGKGNVISATPTAPVTLSGDSLGLRVTGSHQGRLVGTIVAKVDGEWREVTFDSQDALASHR